MEKIAMNLLAASSFKKSLKSLTILFPLTTSFKSFHNSECKENIFRRENFPAENEREEKNVC